MILYLESVIPTNDPDSKNMFLIIKKFQSFSACSSRKARLNINFSKTPNL